ncbi:lipopolysaccharide biosynthesis protein [Chitinophaga oryziterrae]|uniref:Lipopolysaccharide biosynthesis protein n=1 Tax=Chitinophaga oryziterrae TaxID=1031224 RepID=A0A6N8JFS0_9BACT|nr:lipopolysaccharide biosynthesis protein [Chitinophaga oryziterrae]MVT44070.1 lipopolysaccharide biosynthesis protein [Chitinophaga oryziterrae]
MEQNAPTANKPKEELSLRDLVLKLREWWRYLLGKWLIIVPAGLLCGGIGLWLGFNSKPQYIGSLTFVLEESKSSPLGTYAGLASQFGIDLGGGGNGIGVFTGDNIIEFLKSRLMVEKTLLSPITRDGKKITLVDWYIKATKMDESWSEKPSLKGLHYPVGQKRSDFSLQQDSVLNEIQSALVKRDLEVGKPDKKLSFISVQCTTPDEVFSKAFIELLVNEATDFYINTKTKRSKVNVDKLQAVADSIELLLNRKTYSLAAAQDINQNPARQIASAGTEVQSRDKLVLQTMYGEVIKNLELSKMAMAQETPVVQIIDTPILPLKKKKLSKLVGLIVGGFLGGLTAVIVLIVRRLYLDLLMEKA